MSHLQRSQYKETMKHYINSIATVMLVALSVVITACGDDKGEPDNSKSSDFVTGTITVRTENSTNTLTQCAAMSFYEDHRHIDGSMYFSTPLFDKEDVDELSKDPMAKDYNYWEAMLVSNVSYMWSFTIESRSLKVGQEIELSDESILWTGMYPSLSDMTSSQLGGKVTVKAVSDNKITLAFDGLKFYRGVSNGAKELTVNGSVTYTKDEYIVE